VRALLGLTAIFPPALRDDEELVDAVAHWLGALAVDGAAATVRGAARLTQAAR
jgi:hypothetical protein